MHSYRLSHLPFLPQSIRKKSRSSHNGKRTLIVVRANFVLTFYEFLPHGEQMVRYYGWYSNKKRGMRKKEGTINKPVAISEDLTNYQKSCRKRWAALIRKIYEVEPHKSYESM